MTVVLSARIVARVAVQRTRLSTTTRRVYSVKGQDQFKVAPDIPIPEAAVSEVAAAR